MKKLCNSCSNKPKKKKISKTKLINCKVAMGRCQSTPALVETKGRTTLEEMWLAPVPAAITPAPTTATSYSQQANYRFVRFFFVLYLIQNISQFCSQMASPKSTQQRTETSGLKSADSHVSLSPSVHSSEDRPRSRATTSRPQSQPSRTGGE